MSSVRFSLLNQVNDLLFQKKPLSPSSFYNNLQKLEKKGFISFQEDKTSGKAKSVQATPLAKVALQKITQLLIYSGIDMGMVLQKLIPGIMTKTQLTPVRSSLIIPFDELFPTDLFDVFYYKLSKDLYILADDSTFDRYLQRGLTNIHQTKFHYATKMIREPDDMFAVTFLVRYRRTNQLFGISEKKLLQEAIRVTKSNGQLIIFTLDIIPQTNHILLDSLGETIKKSPFFFSLSEQELQSDLQEVGLQDSTILNLNGIIIVRATVP